MDNALEVVEGMKLARGYISPYFITDPKTQKCVSSDLCHSKKHFHQKILNVSKYIMFTQLIFADNFF